jgi:hypothetical protein
MMQSLRHLEQGFTEICCSSREEDDVLAETMTDGEEQHHNVVESAVTGSDAMQALHSIFSNQRLLQGQRNQKAIHHA